MAVYILNALMLLMLPHIYFYAFYATYATNNTNNTIYTQLYNIIILYIDIYNILILILYNKIFLYIRIDIYMYSSTSSIKCIKIYVQGHKTLQFISKFSSSTLKTTNNVHCVYYLMIFEQFWYKTQCIKCSKCVKLRRSSTKSSMSSIK